MKEYTLEVGRVKLVTRAMQSRNELAEIHEEWRKNQTTRDPSIQTTQDTVGASLP